MENIISKKLIKTKLNKTKKSKHDIDIIFKFLNNNNLFKKLFHDFDENCINQIEKMKSICSVFNLTTYKKGETIIIQGTKCRMNFYYILKGEVIVFKKDINKQNSNSVDNNSSKLNSISNREINDKDILRPKKSSKKNIFILNKYIKNILDKKKTTVSIRKLNFSIPKKKIEINYPLEFTEKTLNKEQVLELKKKYGDIISCLKEGYFFGEKSLLEDSKRTATVVLFTKCELIEISKKNFKEKLNTFMNESKFLKENIINISLGKNLNENFYDRILNNLEPAHFKRGQKIIKQNQIIENIYFIIKGEVIVKKIFNKKDIFKMEELNSINLFKKQAFINNSFTPIINYEILIIGDIFGEEIIFEDDCTSDYIFEANSSEVNLFFISKKKIENSFSMNEYFNRELNNIYNFRLKNRNKKLLSYLKNHFNNNNLSYNITLPNNTIYHKIKEDKNKFLMKKKYYIKNKISKMKNYKKIIKNKRIKSLSNNNYGINWKSEISNLYLKTKNINIVKKKNGLKINLKKY